MYLVTTEIPWSRELWSRIQDSPYLFKSHDFIPCPLLPVNLQTGLSVTYVCGGYSNYTVLIDQAYVLYLYLSHHSPQKFFPGSVRIPPLRIPSIFPGCPYHSSEYRDGIIQTKAPHLIVIHIHGISKAAVHPGQNTSHSPDGNSSASTLSIPFSIIIPPSS